MITAKRGEIFYIFPNSPVGSEQQAGRPAIIVSNDKNNLWSGTVEVVYLTTKEKKDLPTHFVTRATGTKSTVLCEQVSTISTEKIGEYIASLTDEEMIVLDSALMVSLGINSQDTFGRYEERKIESADKTELIVVQAERELYKKLYEELLNKIINQ